MLSEVEFLILSNIAICYKAEQKYLSDFKWISRLTKEKLQLNHLQEKAIIIQVSINMLRWQDF